MCPFKLIIKFDRNGYYVAEGSICGTHFYHMKSSQKGKKNLTIFIAPEDLKLCQILWVACTTSTILRTIMYSSTHQSFSRQYIRYVIHPLNYSSKKIVTGNSTEKKFIDDLEKKYPYIMLCNKQDPVSGEMILHSDHDHITA